MVPNANHVLPRVRSCSLGAINQLMSPDQTGHAKSKHDEVSMFHSPNHHHCQLFVRSRPSSQRRCPRHLQRKLLRRGTHITLRSAGFRATVVHRLRCTHRVCSPREHQTQIFPFPSLTFLNGYVPMLRKWVIFDASRVTHTHTLLSVTVIMRSRMYCRFCNRIDIPNDASRQ